MSEELKPCPFCGMIPEVTSEKSFTSLEFNKNYPNNGRDLYLERLTYSIECTCCKQTKGYFTEDEAVTAWNHRVEENKPLSLVEVMLMVGEPVWIENKGKQFGWRIIHSTVLDKINLYGGGSSILYSDYTFYAHRVKPEETT